MRYHLAGLVQCLTGLAVCDPRDLGSISLVSEAVRIASGPLTTKPPRVLALRRTLGLALCSIKGKLNSVPFSQVYSHSDPLLQMVLDDDFRRLIVLHRLIRCAEAETHYQIGDGFRGSGSCRSAYLST